MENCRCPYCMELLAMQDIKYYIRVEKKPVSPRLKAFLAPEKIRPEANPFFIFWDAYKVKISPKTLDERIIKSREELEKAQADFAADAQRRQRNRGFEDDMLDLSEPGTILPGQGADKNLDNTEESAVVCEIRKEQKGQDPPKYVIREDGRRITVTKIACPKCYNVLPEEIFKLPLIKIALAAGKFGGKSCLALSWFRTLSDPNGIGLNSHAGQMDFVSMLEANRGMDDEFSNMLKEFREYNICPAPTNKQFIPPVFLKLNWRGRQAKEAIVGVYDAAGEILTGSLRDDELISYMSYMDGIIYMIEPSKTGIQSGLTNKYLFISNESETFYKNARLLLPEEQMEVQSDDFRRVTLGEIMEQQGQDGMSVARDNSSMEVLTALRGYVDDEKLKQMHVALAISKCDELRGNHEIDEYNQGNLLFMDERKMDPNLNSMREEQLVKLFSEKVFNLQFFENVFKSYSLHMMAALGCPTEVPESGSQAEVFSELTGRREDAGEEKDEMKKTALVKPRLKGDFAPIRVEEPLLKLISIYAEEHGWNE